jgi:hypothetical protein
MARPNLLFFFIFIDMIVYIYKRFIYYYEIQRGLVVEYSAHFPKCPGFKSPMLQFFSLY